MKFFEPVGYILKIKRHSSGPYPYLIKGLQSPIRVYPFECKRNDEAYQITCLLEKLRCRQRQEDDPIKAFSKQQGL